jgi:hypothetical protein
MTINTFKTYNNYCYCTTSYHPSISIYCLKIEIFDNSFAVRFLLCEGHLGGLFLGAAAAATPSTMVLFLDIFDSSILAFFCGGGGSGDSGAALEEPQLLLSSSADRFLSSKPLLANINLFTYRLCCIYYLLR